MSNSLIWRNMSCSEMSFPIEVSQPVAPPSDGLCHGLGWQQQHKLWITLTAICSGVQTSRSTDLTLLICVPMERWMPEQRMHKNTPLERRVQVSEGMDPRGHRTYRFQDAHRGSTRSRVSLWENPSRVGRRTHHSVCNQHRTCSLAASTTLGESSHGVLSLLYLVST